MKSSPLLLALLTAGCLETPSKSADGGPVVPIDAGVEPCGTTRALRDDFEGDSLGPLWEGWGGASGVTGGGRRQIYAGTDVTGGLNTTWFFESEGGEVVVTLESVGLGSDGAFRAVLADGSDSIGLQLAGTALSVVVDVDDATTMPAAITWQEDMLWWRMRAVGGQILWATATNGEDWQEHMAVDNPLPGLVGLVLGLDGGSVQSVVNIDAINPGSTERACPAESLEDEFDVLSPRWAATASAACGVASDGRLVIEYDEGELCGISSLEHFDLRGSAVAIEVVNAGDCDPSAAFSVEIGELTAQIACYFDGEQATLQAGVFGDGGPGALSSGSFDPVSHRLWRIASPAGSTDVIFEVAGAEGNFELLATTPVDPDEIAAVGVSLLVTDESPDGELEQVVFDRLNLVP